MRQTQQIKRKLDVNWECEKHAQDKKFSSGKDVWEGILFINAVMGAHPLLTREKLHNYQCNSFCYVPRIWHRYSLSWHSRYTQTLIQVFSHFHSFFTPFLVLFFSLLVYSYFSPGFTHTILQVYSHLRVLLTIHSRFTLTHLLDVPRLYSGFYLQLPLVFTHFLFKSYSHITLALLLLFSQLTLGSLTL